MFGKPLWNRNDEIRRRDNSSDCQKITDSEAYRSRNAMTPKHFVNSAFAFACKTKQGIRNGRGGSVDCAEFTSFIGSYHRRQLVGVAHRERALLHERFAQGRAAEKHGLFAFIA